LDQGRAKIGDTLAFVAFGAGLTWAASVVKLGERSAAQPVDADWLKRFAFMGSGLSRAFGAVSGSVGFWTGKLIGRNRLN